MRPEDLATAGQLSRRLGVSPSALSNWAKRPVGFPAPWGSWPGQHGRPVRLWVVSEVDDWWAARQADRAARRELRVARLRAQLDRLESTTTEEVPK